MDKKKSIRKNFFFSRKKNFFEIKNQFFNPLKSLIKKKIGKSKFNISLYYPCNFEVNVLKILDIEFFKKFDFSLPIIKKNNEMYFCKWERRYFKLINWNSSQKYQRKLIRNNFSTLLAFDKNKNRIGYGKGYYDKFLNRFLKRKKKPLTVGIAFSFQKYHKLPVSKKDFKLDHIITEKGML